MASKKKVAVKTAKKQTANTAPDQTSKANKMMARILVVVVFLACAWEALQMLNHDVPKLKTELVLKLNAEIKGAGVFIPWGAAAIGKDKIVVADNQNNRLLEFNRKGDFVKSWGKLGKGAVEFHEPSGMTADDQGNAYVLDAWNSAIKGFNENGKEIANIDLTNQGFFGPRGLAFDNGNFLIADTGSHRVVLVGPKGNLISSMGNMGTGEGHFKGPLATATDGKGHYYVADTDNNRVQYLDSAFKKIKYFELTGKVNSVAVDKEGRVYVGTDANDGEVKVFNSNGSVLGTLVDNSGSGEPFRGAKFMTVTSDDMLLMTNGDSVYLYNLPNFNQK
ncbi:MAG TPA: NHL repeat-containing protein [bacterium]|nr:NHL repeat-containing protein [bacterium]